MQWNLLPRSASTPRRRGRTCCRPPGGGKGVVVAVLDTGVAYRRWDKFSRRRTSAAPGSSTRTTSSPTTATRWIATATERSSPGSSPSRPTIALGSPGMAYGASIMPVRVLDASGEGDETTIAQGSATRSGTARRSSTSAWSSCPARSTPAPRSRRSSARSTTRRRRGVTVVGAAGNDETDQIAYPARAACVISVGATTRDLCLARLLQRRVGSGSRRPGRWRRRDHARRPGLPPRPQPAVDLPTDADRPASLGPVRLPQLLHRHVDVLAGGGRDRRA